MMMMNNEQISARLGVENLLNLKRKSLSDDSIIPSRLFNSHPQVKPTSRDRSTGGKSDRFVIQIDLNEVQPTSNPPAKKLKSTEMERTMMEIDPSVTNENSTTKTPTIRVPKHCNGLCE